MGKTSGNGDKASRHAFNKIDSSSLTGNKPASRDNHGQLVIDESGLGSLGHPLSAVSTLRIMEPRILLDAAGLETVESMMEHAASKQADAYFNQSDLGLGMGVSPTQSPFHALFGKRAGDFTPSRTNSHWDIPNGNNEGIFKDWAKDPAKRDFIETLSVPIEAVEFDPPDNRAVVFIDGGVDDIDGLLAGIDPSHDVVILSSDTDGVGQIADYLQGHTEVEEVHILAHGRTGTLELGNTKLTAASMTGIHAEELATIRDALSEDADILIYGCDFAAGSRGTDAVNALAHATGADVAASDDLTGAANLGGDWDLEVTRGDIEAFAIAPTQWAHTLDLTITNVGVTGAGVTGRIGQCSCPADSWRWGYDQFGILLRWRRSGGNFCDRCRCKFRQQHFDV